MSNGFTPMQTGLSRVWLIEGRARPDHEPVYQGCMMAEGIDWGLGDVTSIECPSETEYDKFNEVGRFRGASDRPTISLVGQYAADIESELMRLARIGCAFDMQLHIGVCEIPTNFNDYQKIIVFEDALQTGYSTDPLGSLADGDRSEANETSPLSAREFYEILTLAFAERAETIVTNELVDVVFCDKVSCRECVDYSAGCEKIYSVSLQAGGSPGTPADVVYSLDGGAAWNTSEVDSLGAAEDPTGIACVNGYVVVISNDSCSLHYVLQTDLDAAGDELWIENLVGFVPVLGCPNDIWSVTNYAFIVGDNGYIYGLSDPTGGVVVLDAGAAVGDTLRAVHAMDRNTAVAVGSNGAVVRTLNGGLTWAATNRPTAMGEHLYCVWVKTDTEWFVGTSNGRLLYTVDGGTTWTNLPFNGSGAGVVWDIAFSTDSVATMSHATAAPLGRLLRSYDGGYSWVILPDGLGTIPDNDRFTALALCENDVNLVVGVGAEVAGGDGIIVVGED